VCVCERERERESVRARGRQRARARARERARERERRELERERQEACVNIGARGQEERNCLVMPIKRRKMERCCSGRVAAVGVRMHFDELLYLLRV
jgi:hypothetical protein